MAVNVAAEARRIRGWPSSQSLAGGALAIALGTGLGQALIFLSTPVLTRIYSPSDFGMLGVLIALASTIAAVACLRFDVAIPVPRDEQRGRELLVLALLSALVVAVACLPLVVLLRGPIARALDTPSLAEWLWFLPFMVFAAAAYQALTYWNLRSSTFAAIGRARVVQGAGGVGTQVVLGVALHASPLGLVAGDLASDSAGAAALFTGGAPWAQARRIAPRRLLEAAAEFRRFSAMGSAAAVLNVAALVLPVPLFAALYGSSAAGSMTLTQRLVAGPIVLASGAIGQAFLSRGARLAHDDPAAFGRLYRQLLGWLLAGGAVVAVLGTIAARPVVLAVSGDSWAQAAAFAPYVAITSAAGLVVSPLSQVAFIAHRQGAQLIADASRLLIVIAALVAASRIWVDDPNTGMATYAASMTAVYGGFLLFYHRTAAKISAGGSP